MVVPDKDDPSNPANLPIRRYAASITEAVKANPTVVVIGETGSGKTTQISQVKTRARIYSHMHMRTHTYTHTCTHTQTHTHSHSLSRARTHTHIHTRTHTHIHTYTHSHTHTHITHARTHIQKYAQAHLYFWHAIINCMRTARLTCNHVQVRYIYAVQNTYYIHNHSRTNANLSELCNKRVYKLMRKRGPNDAVDTA